MSENNTKTKEQAKSEWAARERGAIWQYEDKLSITLKNKDGNDVKLVAFRNKFKNESKHPDWRVYTELHKDNSASAKPVKTTEKKVVAPAKKAAPAPEQTDEDFI